MLHDILLQVSLPTMPGAQAGLSDILANVLMSVETKIHGSFDTVTTACWTIGSGLAGIGCLIGLFAPISNMMTGQPLDVSAFVKYGVLAALFSHCMLFADVVDAPFKAFADGLGKSAAAQTQNGETLIQDYETKFSAALAAENAASVNASPTPTWAGGSTIDDVRIAIKNATDTRNVKLMIWMFLAMVVNMIFDLTMFLIKLISIYACELMKCFVPFSFGISFIKGFEGSIMGLAKYIIVFRLWSAVAAAIKIGAINTGMLSAIWQWKGAADSGALQNPDFSLILLQASFIIVMFMTPMLTDILISGSQSGGLFTAAMAKGASALSGAAKATGAAASSVVNTPSKLSNAVDAIKTASSEGKGLGGQLSSAKTAFSQSNASYNASKETKAHNASMSSSSDRTANAMEKMAEGMNKLSEGSKKA